MVPQAGAPGAHEHVRRLLRWLRPLAGRHTQPADSQRNNEPMDLPPVFKGTILIGALGEWSCELLVDMLKESGYGTQVVGGQDEALDALARGDPDLLIVSGPVDPAFYRRLRCASPIPILALVPQADQELMLSAYAAGVDLLLAGFISGSEAVARVHALLRRAS